MRCKTCGEQIFQCMYCGKRFEIDEKIMCENVGYPFVLWTVHWHPDCDKSKSSSVVIE